MIVKLRDKNFQGFICQECGRNLKNAFSINGQGVFGSECVLKVFGIKDGIARRKLERQMKKEIDFSKLWNKVLSKPKVYNLQGWKDTLGNIEAVREKFYSDFIKR